MELTAKLTQPLARTTYHDFLFQEWGSEELQQEVLVLLVRRQRQQFHNLEARQGGPWPWEQRRSWRVTPRSSRPK